MKEKIIDVACIQNNGSKRLKPWQAPVFRKLTINQTEEGTHGGGDQGWLMS